jgi:hypothetical protein
MLGKTIDAQTLALFLVDPTRVKSRKKRTLAQEFLESHSVRSISKALRDGRTKIDLTYCVKAYVKLFHDERARISDQLAIIDRFRELIVLGAIQDPNLAEYLTRAVARLDQKEEKMSDPFLIKPRLLKKEA